MSVSATYAFFAGLLLIARGAFIAVPAWSKWTRNLALVRIGVKTTGRYRGERQIAFLLEQSRQITFSTWRAVVRRSHIGDALSVLYNPAQPYKAEVLTPFALWTEPLSNLVLAITHILTGIFLLQGMNFILALFFMLVVEWPVGYLFARLALYFFYPASRLHQFDVGEASPGPGRSHSRRQRRWRRQLDWKEQPHMSESKGPLVSTAQEVVPVLPTKRRADRDLFLCDMVSIPDSWD